MSPDFKFYILYAVLYGVILFIGEGLYRILKLNSVWSRNFSHLAAGVASLPYPWIFSSHWWVLLIAAQSIIVLYLTRIFNIIPSHHQTAGRSLGSYLFFVSIYLCYIVSSYLDKPQYFVFPILLLSVSDVSASIFGRHLGRIQVESISRLFAEGKTLVGSGAFFVSSLFVTTAFYYFYLQASFTFSFGIACVITMATTFIEALSRRGYDNFFIPSVTLIIMYLVDFL